MAKIANKMTFGWHKEFNYVGFGYWTEEEQLTMPQLEKRLRDGDEFTKEAIRQLAVIAFEAGLLKPQ